MPPLLCGSSTPYAFHLTSPSTTPSFYLYVPMALSPYQSSTSNNLPSFTSTNSVVLTQSSTCALHTEWLQYFHPTSPMSNIDASILAVYSYHHVGQALPIPSTLQALTLSCTIPGSYLSPHPVCIYPSTVPENFPFPTHAPTTM